MKKIEVKVNGTVVLITATGLFLAGAIWMHKCDILNLSHSLTVLLKDGNIKLFVPGTDGTMVEATTEQFSKFIKTAKL